jgi:hypothetical protein
VVFHEILKDLIRIFRLFRNLSQNKMTYIETARKIKVEIEKKRKDLPIKTPVNHISNQGNFCSLSLNEKNEFNEKTAIHLEEAACLFMKRGWIQMWSGYLKQAVFLVRDKKVKIPDATLPKYTQVEIQSLKELSWEEVRTLHQAKCLFQGTIGKPEVKNEIHK